jgi:hypothetical protein
MGGAAYRSENDSQLRFRSARVPAGPASQPDPIAAASTAVARSAAVSTLSRRSVSHAGLRAAAQARMPVAAAVAVAAVAMHWAHIAPQYAGARAVHKSRTGQTAAWCFAVALAGGAVGLVLGNIRLPAVLLVASSPAAGAGANIGISGVAAFAAAGVDVRAAVVSGALIGLLGGLVGLILGAPRMPALLPWVGEGRIGRSGPPGGRVLGRRGGRGGAPAGRRRLDGARRRRGSVGARRLLGARLTGRLSERQLLRAIGAVLVVAGTATAVQAL